jgi:AcrR family transcriptional regulator
LNSRERKNNEIPGARERILDAGIHLFAAKGYASTSVREIVERAGVTKPVLYYHFKNKEGLFVAILEWASEMQGEVLHSALEQGGSTLERLIQLARRVYRGVMEHQSLFIMIHNLVFGPPQGTPDYDLEAYHRRMVEAIRGICCDGVAAGDLKETDADDLATLVLGIIDFCLHLDQIHPNMSDPMRPERLLRLAHSGFSQRKEV